MHTLIFAAIAAASLGAAPDLKSTLTEAIQDEYRAEGTYRAVMMKFGEVRPFSNIIRAEQMHIRLVADLMGKYGYPVPVSTFLQRKDETAAAFMVRMNVPDTFTGAAKQAVGVEESQIPFYNRLLKQTLPDDVRQVFVKLQADSRDRHLVAFRRFAGTSMKAPPATSTAGAGAVKGAGAGCGSGCGPGGDAGCGG